MLLEYVLPRGIQYGTDSKNFTSESSDRESDQRRVLTVKSGFGSPAPYRQRYRRTDANAGERKKQKNSKGARPEAKPPAR